MMAFALVLTLVAVALTVLLRNVPEQADASEKETSTKSSVGALIRGERPSEPGPEKAPPLLTPEVSKNESNLALSGGEPKSALKPAPEAKTKSQSESFPHGESPGQARPGREPAAQAQSGTRPELPAQVQAGSRPEPQAQRESNEQPETNPEQGALPAGESDWPRPTHQEVEAANEPRHYNLPAGAIMGLTIRSMGIYNAPVFDSDSQWALANGIAHVPETSLPWSPAPQRNVYLAGHRMGYRGTWSRMLFYNLNEVGKGDKVMLKDRTGRIYEYRVSETFLADPADSWVMGQVRGRDMLTLQTCTPIPTFEKRLIVRADRL
jgi:sortase A